MKKIEFKLKIHTPWHRFNNKINIDSKDINKFLKIIRKQELAFNNFKCGELCNIEINNIGNVRLSFFNDTDHKEVNHFIALFIYYISILNGFNCEISKNCKIDGKTYKNYFPFPKEDSTPYPLMKNVKFYEISLESIKNVFGDNMYKLYTHSNRDFLLSILSNYYSTVFYKDFSGNLEYKFRNIITNLEAIITIINREKYNNYRLKNKEKIKEFKIQIHDINDYVLPKSKSLQDKLKDLFTLLTELFGLSLKNNLNKECERLANTRNFISHLFEEQKNIISHKEMADYTSALSDVFRMLFLYYLGFDSKFIKTKFFRSLFIKQKMSLIFSFT